MDGFPGVRTTQAVGAPGAAAALALGFGELGPNGLPVDRGERQTFGDPSLLDDLRG
ncbi:MAG: hypothetical protein ACFCVK_09700 [Acidimicrobiales bacterium]